MLTPIDGRGRHPDLRPILDHRLARLAIDRMNGVGVARARVDGVVGPAELLNWANVARHRITGRVVHPREVEQAIEPAMGPVPAGALDRKTEKALTFAPGDVVGEENPGAPGVGLERHAVVLVRCPHASPTRP
jgi:hypothetical protein